MKLVFLEVIARTIHFVDMEDGMCLATVPEPGFRKVQL